MSSVTDSPLAGLLERLPGEGVFSVWFGPVEGTAWLTREDDARHYAASTMKIALALTAYRLADAGALDLDGPIRVHDDFASAAGSTAFVTTRDYDNDDVPWQLLGGTATPRWLARRAIVSSSNLATNLLLELVGAEAVQQTLTELGCHDSVVQRGIQDAAAGAAGLSNEVSARDLATQLRALASGAAGSPETCAELLAVLGAQEINNGIPAGLPAGTPVAHKSGWVEGVTHDAALVTPPDGPPFVLVVLTTSALGEDEGHELVASVAAAAWESARQAARQAVAVTRGDR